jgi:outer membrane biosynthesis protein TonB
VGSLEILSSSDELFARSVREAVRHLRFAPAQLAGRSVKALVVQPFQFVVR